MIIVITIMLRLTCAHVFNQKLKRHRGEKLWEDNCALLPDTIQYWNLTRDIYRFSPAREGTRFGVHTVDEHIDMMARLEGMRLYYG